MRKKGDARSSSAKLQPKKQGSQLEMGAVFHQRHHDASTTIVIQKSRRLVGTVRRACCC